MSYGLGVDLGTTYTAAAVRADGQVEVVRLGGRRAEIPSLVFLRADGEVLIGEAAERRGGAEPGRLAREFKRRVGDPVPVLVGGSPYPAHALMGRLLQHVVATVAEKRQEQPEAIAVTRPANWGPYKQELLLQAVRLAELDYVEVLTEPEAAAVQYAAGGQVRTDDVVAVFDLGGGTFDAAALRRTSTGFALLGQPEGIEQLGGIDFDEAVFTHVVTTLGGAVGELDPDDNEVTDALARLRRDCVEAKEALSYDTEVMIPVALPGLHTRVRLNRSEFEAMISPALGETVSALRRALRSADVQADQLRCIVLSGGSSRIPLVGQLLAEEFGRPVVPDPHPEHAIALGAALVTGVGPALTAVEAATAAVGSTPAPTTTLPPPDEPAGVSDSTGSEPPGPGAAGQGPEPVGDDEPTEVIVAHPAPGAGRTPGRWRRPATKWLAPAAAALAVVAVLLVALLQSGGGTSSGVTPSQVDPPVPSTASPSTAPTPKRPTPTRTSHSPTAPSSTRSHQTTPRPPPAPNPLPQPSRHRTTPTPTRTPTPTPPSPTGTPVPPSGSPTSSPETP